MAAGMDHVIEDGRRARRRRRGRARPRPRVADRRAAARTSALRFTKFLAYGWSSQRSLPSVRDQVDAAVASAPSAPAGTTLVARPARVPGRLLGRAPTSRSTATASSSRPSASRSSTRCRPAPAPSAARSPAKGLTGPGYDGHAFWDTETFVLPLLTYTQPRGRRATRCAGATRRSTSRCERAQTAAGWRARRSRGARSAGRSARRTGRPGTAGVPRQRRHRRRRRSATCGRPATRSSRPAPASSCWCRPRGCGARSATTTTRARSTSTASPARTSTRRSPTTTSTRT